jgi:hypothetical protein
MTFFISSTVLSWKHLDLNIINSLNISCLNQGLNKNTIKSPKYYCEGSRKLKILHARLRHQCSSLNSGIFRINITNDSKWQSGSPFEDPIHYIMECPLHQNENFKVKCKGHNFFQISIFLDRDFSTLISKGNSFQFSQDFRAKSSVNLPV